MILIADKLILCGSCGERIGFQSGKFGQQGITILKDRYVVAGDERIYFCNQQCKDKTRV